MTASLFHKAEHQYFDAYTKKETVKILPGEFFVCSVKIPMVCTTLGSCIAACIWDGKKGIGGMNHFMLAQSEMGGWGEHVAASARFGNFAMEYLINEILKQGADKLNLKAKIFGGASMGLGSGAVGQQNIAFAKDYLNLERIPLLEEDTGGLYGRKVYFEPATGQVNVRRIQALDAGETLQKRENRYQNILSHQEDVLPQDDDKILF